MFDYIIARNINTCQSLLPNAILGNMDVYISFDGDHIGREVGRLALQDDETGLRKISHAIEMGNELWAKWVEAKGGSVISTGGDEGRIKVSAEHLEEIPSIRKRYEDLVGSTVSVGVGRTLSESNRALIAAKLRGGDQVVMYEEGLEEEIEQAQNKGEEGKKIFSEYLEDAPPTKQELAQSLYTPYNEESEGDEISKAQRPMAPAKPMAEASEHSQGEAMANLYQDENPPQPELTHAAEGLRGLEGEFHQMAQQQNQAPKSESGNQELKSRLAGVLQKLKGQAPVLEQMKQQAPETYAAIMAMVQSVISMARSLSSDAGQDPKKQEEQEKAAKSERQDILHGGAADEKDYGDFDPEQLKIGIKHEMEHTKSAKIAAEIAMDHLTEDPDYYKKLKTIEKTDLPTSGRHKLVLPPGSTITTGPQGRKNAGKIKVQHGNGKSSWVHVRSGQVLSEDGHAISSRNPKGR